MSEIDWQFWFLFPVAMAIAILAMAIGVSGANFWAPLYLLWLRLDTSLGFWLSLVSMLFGFSSGVVRNLRQGTVNLFLLRPYLTVALPATVLGAVAAPFVSARWLFLAFAVFLFLYTTHLVLTLRGAGGGGSPPRQDRIAWRVAVLGGVLTGLITVGLGELLVPHCLRHPRCQTPAEAVGTTVTIVFVVSLCAALVRLTPELVAVLHVRSRQLWSMLVFVIPGVLIGGQLGPRIAVCISPPMLQRLRIGVLYLISGLMLWRFCFTPQ
ncbi:MAG: sulfite exporter TauE/SafE family protein [Candidatus Binatia bacterium]